MNINKDEKKEFIRRQSHVPEKDGKEAKEKIVDQELDTDNLDR